MDISSTGLGLVAGHPGKPLPAEGDLLDLQLALPESGAEIQARAKVRWRHDAAVAGHETGVALGLQFVSMPVRDQTDLAHYLEDYRFHVAVALAGEADHRLAERALGSRTRLHFAASAGGPGRPRRSG